MNTSAYASYVLWIVLCGFCMGTVFDIYNTVTGAARILRPLRPLLDVVFWLASGVVVYVVTFRTISGEFRVWTFVLVGLGYLLYRVLLRRTIIRSAFVIVQIMKAIVLFFSRLLYRLIGVPLLVCGRGLWGAIHIVYIAGCRVEDVIAAILRMTIRIVLFPWKRLLTPLRPWQKILLQWEEGFWTWLSNLLRKKSGPAS